MIKRYDHTDGKGRVRSAILTIDEKAVAQWLIARMIRSGTFDVGVARMAGGAIELRFEEEKT